MTGGKRRQTTAMKTMIKIDPLKGIVKPDELVAQLRKLRDGNWDARSYVTGAAKYLRCHPPNEHIVPLLEKALVKFKVKN